MSGNDKFPTDELRTRRPHSSFDNRHSSFSFMTRVSSRKNARHVIQHIRRTLVVVSVVADEPTLHDIDLLLRVGIDHIRYQARKLDRILLILEQLQLERFV